MFPVGRCVLVIVFCCQVCGKPTAEQNKWAQDEMGVLKSYGLGDEHPLMKILKSKIQKVFDYEGEESDEEYHKLKNDVINARVTISSRLEKLKKQASERKTELQNTLIIYSIKNPEIEYFEKVTSFDALEDKIELTFRNNDCIGYFRHKYGFSVLFSKEQMKNLKYTMFNKKNHFIIKHKKLNQKDFLKFQKLCK